MAAKETVNVSKKSIAAYESRYGKKPTPVDIVRAPDGHIRGTHTRNHGTLPPPSAGAYAASIRQRASDLRAAAARILANAAELEESAARLEGAK